MYVLHLGAALSGWTEQFCAVLPRTAGGNKGGTRCVAGAMAPGSEATTCSLYPGLTPLRWEKQKKKSRYIKGFIHTFCFSCWLEINPKTSGILNLWHINAVMEETLQGSGKTMAFQQVAAHDTTATVHPPSKLCAPLTVHVYVQWGYNILILATATALSSKMYLYQYIALISGDENIWFTNDKEKWKV